MGAASFANENNRQKSNLKRHFADAFSVAHVAPLDGARAV
ncbi:MAG: hypothetical protein ACI90E_002515, partial [Yoonia sp.]